MKRIYLDYAAATPLLPEAREEMEKYYSGDFGNPDSIHEEGQRARKALESARRMTADALSAKPSEIFFTSGGTESNNLAIRGVFEALLLQGKDLGEFHAVVTNIEHSSVLNVFEPLKEKGLKLSRLKVDSEGLVPLDELERKLSPETALVSVMFANNEIGTIEPIKEISSRIRRFEMNERGNQKDSQKVLFHSDGSQAILYNKLNVDSLGVDMLTVDGAKIYGPKGSGVLFIKEDVQKRIAPILDGGGQEKGLRSGTPNVPAIVGLAKAIEIAERDREKEEKRLKELQGHFMDLLLNKIPGLRINGSKDERMPNNINLSVKGADGEMLVIALDKAGIATGTGSACKVGGSMGSHVIEALYGKEENTATLRFTMGRGTTKDEVEETVRALEKVLDIHRT